MKKSKSNLIYLIQMGNTKYYKIGITNDINKRISTLQTGNPLPLHTITTIEMKIEGQEQLVRSLEKDLHLAFRYCRQVGEWFKFEKDEQEIFTKWAEVNIIQDINDFIKLFKDVRDYQLKIGNEDF